MKKLCFYLDFLSGDKTPFIGDFTSFKRIEIGLNIMIEYEFIYFGIDYK